MMPLWWDGVGFFGFDHKKLDRLEKGAPPVYWYSRFKSLYYTLSLIMITGAIIYIVVGEISKLNTVKSQTTSLVMF